MVIFLFLARVEKIGGPFGLDVPCAGWRRLVLRVAVPAAARRVLGATDAALVRVHGDERADGGAELHGDGGQGLCGILSFALLRTERVWLV